MNYDTAEGILSTFLSIERYSAVSFPFSRITRIYLPTENVAMAVIGKEYNVKQSRWR
jgi:hypothetical protein